MTLLALLALHPKAYKWCFVTMDGYVFTNKSLIHSLPCSVALRLSSSASPHSPNAAMAPTSVKTAVVKPVARTKPRRYMPSQIPSQPVEMPVGVDTLNLEVCLCCGDID